MATGKMYDCEALRPRMVDGNRVLAWMPMAVKHLPEGNEVRCRHCHGPVRVRRQRVPDGPQDHVGHKLGSDAKNCQGSGELKAGQEHQMSSAPVGG